MTKIHSRGRTCRLIKGRTFGGVYYKAMTITNTKKDAQKEAKMWRDKGYGARVLPYYEFGIKSYAIYRTENKIRKSRDWYTRQSRKSAKK